MKALCCDHKHSSMITASKEFPDSIILILKPHFPPPFEGLSVLIAQYSLTLSKKQHLAFERSVSLFFRHELTGSSCGHKVRARVRFSLDEQLLVLMNLFYFISYAILEYW